jgi:HYR domain
LTRTFTEYSFGVPDGSDLDIQITTSIDGASEELAYDNIVITGTTMGGGGGGGELVISFSDVIDTGICPALSVITRTWSSVDACGNIGTDIQIITVEDNDPPTLTAGSIDSGYADAATAEAAAIAATAASDGCGGAVTLAASTDGDCSAIVTVTGTDSCGNEASVTYDTRIDTTAPVVAPPTDVTVGCTDPTDPSATGTATVTDNCDVSTTTLAPLSLASVDFTDFTGTGFSPTPAAGQLDSDVWQVDGLSDDADMDFGDTKTSGDFARGISSGAVGSGGVYAFDVGGGNIAMGIQPGGSDYTPGTQIFRDIVNTTGETITSLDLSYRIYVLNDQGRANSFNFAHSADGVTFTDEPSLDYTSVEAIDALGWVAVDRSISLSVSIPPGGIYYLQWSGNDVSGGGSRDEFALDDILAATTVSVTSGGPSLTYSDSTAGTCPVVITRSWSSTDSSGNIGSADQTITVEDSVPPILSGQGADSAIECPAEPVFTAPTASDDCGAATVVEISDTITPAACEGTYIRTMTWKAVDECGNESAPVSQSITVQDSTGPMIAKPADVTLACGSPDTSPDATGWATAVDSCDTGSGGGGVLETIAAQSFEVDGVGYIPGAEFNDSGSDHFGRTDGSDIANVSGDYLGADGTWFMAGEDQDDNGGDGLDEKVVIVDQDISAHTGITVSGLFAAGNENGPGSSAYDSTDYLLVEYSVDGGAWTKGLEFRYVNSGDVYNEPIAQDTDFDGMGDGAVLTRTFTEFSFTVPDGSDLDIQITTRIDGGNEELAYDNIVITGTSMGGGGSGLTVTYFDTMTSSGCAEGYTIARSWSASDACGNIGSAVQIIAVADEEAPVLSGQGADATIECPVTPSFTAPTATDNCAAASVISFADSTAAGACAEAYSVTRTWEAVDACGNVSASVSQTITVQDSAAPVLSGVPGDTTVECDAIPAAPAVTALDDCIGSVSVVFSETSEDGACSLAMTITRTWTAEDSCGNVVSASQTIIVQDTTSPEIVIPADATLECPADTSVAANGSATATDNCDTASGGGGGGVLETIASQSFELDGVGYIPGAEFNDGGSDHFGRTDGSDIANVSGDYLGADGTWFMAGEDQDDNGGDGLDEKVVIVDQDISAHTGITVSGLFAAGNENGPGSSGYDAPDYLLVEYSVDGGAWEKGLEFRYVDNGDAYNEPIAQDTDFDGMGDGAVLTRTFTEYSFGVPDGSDLDIQITTSIDGASEELAYDNIVITGTSMGGGGGGGDLVVTHSDSLVTGCGGSEVVTRTWTATDGCGNSISDAQILTVVDTQAPVLAGVPADETVSCEAIPAAPTVTAADACEGAVTATLDEVDNVVDGCGTIVRTWTAADACGNTATASQTITVEDIVAPVLAGVPADETVSCDAIPAPAVVTATDNCDSTLAVDFSEVDGLVEGCGTIVRTWTVVDTCGNTATASQTLTVEDTEAPVLAGVPADATVSCDAIPAPATVTASDTCDPTVTVGFSEVNSVIEGSGTIVRTWSVTDSCGNTATASQTLTVEDTEAPVLAGIPADETVSCNAIPAPAVVTASDNCDSTLTVDFSEVDGVVEGCGTIVRTWTVADSSGNSSSDSQILTVEDTVAPVLAGVPADLLFECDEEVPEAAIVTATDNCDPTLDVVFSEELIEGDCASAYTLVRTWTVEDSCGNAASNSQAITVQDTVPPVLIGVANQSVVPIAQPARFTADVELKLNNKPIPAGQTIWFSSTLKINHEGHTETLVGVENSTITFTANGTDYTVDVPDGIVYVKPVTDASTVFNTADNRWETITPRQKDDNVFLIGVAFTAPVDLPGNIRATWTGDFYNDRLGVTADWKASAAVYTTFSTDYNALDVKPVDGKKHHSHHHQKDQMDAGTPYNYKEYVVEGGTSRKHLHRHCGRHRSDYTGKGGKYKHVIPHKKQALMSICSDLTVFELPEATDNCGEALVTCDPPSGSELGPGVHTITATAVDGCGNTSTDTFTVTVLQPIRVVFEGHLHDDNIPDNMSSGREKTDPDWCADAPETGVVVNKFKSGSCVKHQIKLYSCDGVNITGSALVTAKIDVTQRVGTYQDSILVVDVPEDYAGVGDPAGTMELKHDKYEFNLKTIGYESGTLNTMEFFRSVVLVDYDAAPGVNVGIEDVILESKH